MSANQPTQPEQQQLLEDRLFFHFRGWTWSERAHDTSSWLWDLAMTFSVMAYANGPARTASSEIVPSSRAFLPHVSRMPLWRKHKTPAPEREKRSAAQLKSEGALKSSQPTIASVLKLDINKPREQNIANCVISRFDKQHFQRMLAELIVSSNQFFSFVENPILRDIFDSLSPSVSIQHANLSARAIQYKIIQQYKCHKRKVIHVLNNAPGLLHISFDGWTSRN